MTSEPTVVLSQKQIEFFHETGFLSIQSITTREEIAALRQAYDRLFADRTGWLEGMQFDIAGKDAGDGELLLPQISGPARYSREFRYTQLRTNARAICRQLLGKETRYQSESAILKPARIGSANPWHQDEAYWHPDRLYRTVTVWIPLDDVHERNGCMHFIPGSHRLPVLPHRAINNDPEIHGLEVAGEFDTTVVVACPIPAGGATFHASRTLHFTPPNQTEQPRRAYIMTFCLPAVRREDPESFRWLGERRTARMRRALPPTKLTGIKMAIARRLPQNRWMR